MHGFEAFLLEKPNPCNAIAWQQAYARHGREQPEPDQSRKREQARVLPCGSIAQRLGAALGGRPRARWARWARLHDQRNCRSSHGPPRPTLGRALTATDSLGRGSLRSSIHALGTGALDPWSAATTSLTRTRVEPRGLARDRRSRTSGHASRREAIEDRHRLAEWWGTRAAAARGHLCVVCATARDGTPPLRGDVLGCCVVTQSRQKPAHTFRIESGLGDIVALESRRRLVKGPLFPVS
jgi:hypothetical protein